MYYVYSSLVGTPPFETNTLKSTYSKIKKNEYFLPVNLDLSAKNLIKHLLHPDPTCRPYADEILNDDFLTCFYIPASCLFMAPRSNHNMSMCQLAKKKRSLITMFVCVSEALIITRIDVGMSDF